MPKTEVVKIGVIGAGVFGGYHAAKCAQNPRAELVGIYDPDGEAARAGAQKHGTEAFDDVDTLIAGADALIIACPAVYHDDMALKALSAGRSVLIEKPIATSVEGAAAITALAGKKGLIVQVGHQERFVMRAIGVDRAPQRPTLIKARRMGPYSPRGTDVSVTLDLMTHDIDMALWLIGEAPSRIEGHSRAVKSETPDIASAVLHFPSGASAELEASRVAQGRDRVMEIHYPSGLLKIDFIGKTFEDSTGFGFNPNFGNDPSAADSLGAGTDAFISAVLGQAAPPITGEDGLAALKAALAIDAGRDPALEGPAASQTEASPQNASNPATRKRDTREPATLKRDKRKRGKWLNRSAISLAAILALGAGGLALNWDKIERLQTVTTLFYSDVIVHNFSHMNEAFLHENLAASPAPYRWPEALRVLPETVMIDGKTEPLMPLLEQLDTTALVILKDGNLVFEEYYRGTSAKDRRISWSVAKSFMSGLYGQALESGAIESLDDPVEKYVPSLKGSAYEGATLRNVLNMASGIEFNEDYMDPKSDINDMGRVLALGRSMDKYAAGLTQRRVPAGTDWQYVSIDTHVAAMALRAATGKSLHTLFNETYSANLGFDQAPYYLTDGKGVAFALGGLNLTTRDYAKFGQLFLQGGQFGGKQVIPADWVEASTRDTAPTASGKPAGYGYQWWIPLRQSGPNKGDYFAVGIYGQYIYINPARNIVIAKNAADREFVQNRSGSVSSMDANIEMMRSLADYYSQETAP